MHLPGHQDAHGPGRHDNPAAAVAVPAHRAEAQAELIPLMRVAWCCARGPWRGAVPLQDDAVVDASPDVMTAAVGQQSRTALGAIGHDRMLCNAHRMSESSVPRPSRLDRVADAVDAQRVGAAWVPCGRPATSTTRSPLSQRPMSCRAASAWRTMSSVCATSGTTNVSANRPSRILGPCRSTSTPTLWPLASPAARTLRYAARWLAWLPWLMLSRATSSPGGHQRGNQGQPPNKGS